MRRKYHIDRWLKSLTSNTSVCNDVPEEGATLLSIETEQRMDLKKKKFYCFL